MNRNEDGSFRRGLKRSNSKEAWIAPCAASPLAYVYASIPVPHSISICAVHVWGPPPITCELLISRAGKIRGKLSLIRHCIYWRAARNFFCCVIFHGYIYIYIIRGFLIITGNSLLLSGTKRSWIVILYQSPAFISMLTPLSKIKYFTDYKKNTWCRSSHVTSREAWQKHLVYRNRPDHSSSGLMTFESLLMGAGNGVAGPGPPSYAWNDETGTRSNSLSLSLSRPRHSAWKSTPSALTGPLNVPRRICEERFFRP